MASALSGKTEAGGGNAAIKELEKKLENFLKELDDFYILRPIVSENCNVTLTELDTIYSFQGLSELHILLDTKINFMDLEEQKMNTGVKDGK